MEQQTEIAPFAADPEVGLTAAQAEERVRSGLVSGDPAPVGKTEKQIILAHCFTFFNFIFLVLALALVLSGSRLDNMGFLIIVVINTALGILQEIRAKRAVDALVLVARRPVQIVREGALTEVPANVVVRDDIAEFASGDQLCADGILRSGALTVDESLITGEADAVRKAPGDLLHSGSVVLTGRGRAQLTAVGEACEAARLSREAKADPKAAKSEMMRSLDHLILFVGIALVPVGLILFYQEYYVLQLGLQRSAAGTVAALVGMIPEGLYLLTTVALAVSARKLSKQRVLVQDQNCIESLARVDVLCVDKTGTITEPELEVADVCPLNDLPHEELQSILTALYGSGTPDNDTGRAIQELFPGSTDWVCTKRISFSSDWKWAGASFENRGSYLVGAPETVMGDRYDSIREAVEEWADLGYRVLLAASFDGELTEGKLDEAAITPLALILMTSRIRPQASETFAYFEEQGVRVVVISGDNPAAVSRIAISAGIPGAEEYIDAREFETEEEYDYAVSRYNVFGRVTPEQKRLLVAALQRQKHTVAMTGDGVNDLLAMKQADCSVAMASGAQAASQLASLVLLDSDFSAMPGIVAEGRRVINNIQRAATLFLVKNIFSLFLSVITLFTNWAYPLEPIHLTVISFLTIGLPSFLLTLEPRYERIQGHFLRGVLRRAFPGGLTNVFVVLVCEAFIAVFSIPQEAAATVSAGILAVVGLLVLFQVCKPFDRFRAVLWAAMAVGLVVVFTALNGIFRLTLQSAQAQLLMLALLLMTPTVFFAIQRLFDFGDRCLKRFRK